MNIKICTLAAASSVVVVAMSAAAPPLPHGTTQKVVYISNRHIRLGVNLSLGGAITCLQRVGGRNMVNGHDWGRQIQMSDYSGPVPYEPDGKKPQPVWAGLGWNPIQSGDAFGNQSKVVSFSVRRHELTVTCIPMHWPLNNVPAHCTYTSTISLHANAVTVHCTVALHRQDTTQYAARPQELPAVYTNGPWYRIFTYSGVHPFHNGALTREPSVFMWRSWMATEHWAALVDKADRGLGIWEPTAVQFSGGFAGSPGAGGPHDNPTGYLAPNQMEILDNNIVYSYDYTLIVGTVSEIRKYVYTHTPSSLRTPLPAYTFSDNRNHWHYVNAIDSGWPVKAHLHIIPQSADPQVVGPLNLWRATSGDVLVMRAAFKGSTGVVRLFFRPYSQPHFDTAHSISFPVTADGRYHTYRIPLRGAPGYAGSMIQLRLDPYVVNPANAWIDLQEVQLINSGAGDQDTH